jgi:hypothetical protein
MSNVSMTGCGFSHVLVHRRMFTVTPANPRVEQESEPRPFPYHSTDGLLCAIQGLRSEVTLRISGRLSFSCTFNTNDPRQQGSTQDEVVQYRLQYSIPGIVSLVFHCRLHSPQAIFPSPHFPIASPILSSRTFAFPLALSPFNLRRLRRLRRLRHCTVSIAASHASGLHNPQSPTTATGVQPPTMAIVARASRHPASRVPLSGGTYPCARPGDTASGPCGRPRPSGT